MSSAHFVHGLPGSCIYCGMEKETILYYHPVSEGPAEEKGTAAAKKHWFGEAVLQVEVLTEEEEFCALGCVVPPFYYRRKTWNAQILSETMETALHAAAGMPDTWVHPDVLGLLAKEEWSRWAPRESTTRMLTRHLLKLYAREALAQNGTVTVLLGQPAKADRQMETTWELLQPYLPRVNRMMLYYEKQEIPRDWEETEPAGGEEKPLQSAERESRVRRRWLSDGVRGSKRRGRFHAYGDEAGGGDTSEVLQGYLEDYYYEYGLVPQLLPYAGSRESALRCGKDRCGGVILDYSEDFRYPKIMPDGSVYIDVASDSGKERAFRQKSLMVPYVSPLKYLDTLVKNSYDRKVKMTSEIPSADRERDKI